MVRIRNAKIEDASQLLAIYAPYVTETAITFETSLPSLTEFEKRIQTTQQSFPYLLAEEDGEILGYAYAHPYYGRAAYDWTVEVSIYIRKDLRKSGIGTLLYDQLEKKLQQQQVVNLLACISLPNIPSVAFHQKRGYEEVGHFKKVGYKFEQWHDIVWLQKQLKAADKPLPLQKPLLVIE